MNLWVKLAHLVFFVLLSPFIFSFWWVLLGAGGKFQRLWKNKVFDLNIEISFLKSVEQLL